MGSASPGGASGRGLVGGILAAGGAALAPHLLCLAGLGSAIGIGGYSIHQWCGHADSAADSSHGVEIRRLPKIPEEYKEFSTEKNLRAKAKLLEIEPRFSEIILAKQLEAEGAPIEVVFIEDADEHVSVVICKNGALCPCSKPQAYDVGSRGSVAQPEAFRGQHALLMALFRETSEVPEHEFSEVR